MLPPDAARPFAYVTSAMPAKTPASLATSTCSPGPISAPVPQSALRVTVAPLAVTYTSSRPSIDSGTAEGL
jgi:hypothetical protein